MTSRVRIANNSNMARNVAAVCLFLVSVLETISGFVAAVEEHRQAFIQTDSELRYLVDGISLHLHQSLTSETELSILSSDEKNTNGNSYTSPVTFYPSELNFKDHPVGMPDLATVIVSNPNLHNNVYLLSISGSTVHFHCSFFQDKVIPPGGNTTFSVVFLSRQEGPVHNTLFIHTSAGSYKYQVFGVGTANPYRLRPLLGARVPLNSVYSSMINMYNPHSSPIQVTEMYSSGGDLHLELPTGGREAMQQLWEIQPYETKSVMKANFIARVENNHTVYIRIKTNSSSDDYLVLPVEVEVSSAPGIYTTTDTLEFGLMYSRDTPRTLALHLLNRGPKAVQITSISATPTNDALSIAFQPVKVPPDTTQPIQVASITFHPLKALNLSQFSGKIVIRSKNNQFRLTVPYVATVLHGSLEYNSSETEFYVGEAKTDDKLQRNLTLTNKFNVSVAIHHIELSTEAKQFFEVKQFNSLVLKPKEMNVVGFVKLINYTNNVRLNTYLRFYTNVSELDVPLLYYNGKLTKFLPLMESSSKMDLGTLSLSERRDVSFAVINDNPINVPIRSFGSSIIYSVVEFLGVSSGNVSEVVLVQNFSGLSKELVIPPSHFAIFRIGIAAPKDEESFVGEIFVETLFEILKISLSFRTAKGALAVVPPSVTFEPAFPGKVASVHLYLQSTFMKPMTVLSVIPLHPDSRFTYKPPKTAPPILQPNARTLVGKLQFDVRSNCQPVCYTGFSIETQGGSQWASCFSLPLDVSLVDVELYEILQSRWKEVLSSNQKRVNVTFQIDTSEVRGFRVAGHALLSWPTLSNKQKIIFPLTQIGNSSVKDLYLENPSNVPVLAQIVPLHYYPTPEAVFNILEHSGLVTLMDSLTADEKVFCLKDPGSWNTQFASLLKDAEIHPETVALLLEPGTVTRVSLEFTPTGEFDQSSVLLIRNNLTVLETVLLQGTGAYGQLRFGNRVPGSGSPLLFELTEKHLRDCDSPHLSQYSLPNFTVRRSFTVRNTGPLPVYISGFDINSSPCEGYGFRVLNCHGFHLNPNDSTKVDIAFTPDFSLSKIQRLLNVRTSLSDESSTLNFSLVATVPAYILARCALAIPRPLWEPLLYYIGMSLMGFLLFCVVVAAYLESDRIYRCTFIPMTLTAYPSGERSSIEREFGKVFDLKSISSKVSGRLPSELSNSLSDSVKRRSKDQNSFEMGKINLLKTQNSSVFSRTSDVLRDTDSLRMNRKKGGGGGGGGRKSQFVKLSSLSSGFKSSSISPKFYPGDNCGSKNFNASASSDKSLTESNELDTLNKSTSSSESRKSSSKRRNSSDMSHWTSKGFSINRPKQSTKSESSNVDGLNTRRKFVKDETAATENSSLEADGNEKEKVSKATGNRNKARSLNFSTRGPSGKTVDASCEGEVETNARSKQKKNAGDQQATTASVLRAPIFPITVMELPYKPKVTTNAKSESPRSILQREKDVLQLKSNLSKKQPPTSKIAVVQTFKETSDGNTETGLPPALWDQPKQIFSSDDAYNEIVNQTETFAMKASRMGREMKEAPFASSQPMASRQGIPPLSSTKAHGLNTAKVTPVGKIAPEPKIVDPKELGPVGQRPPSFKSLPVPSGSCWRTSPITDLTSPVHGTPCTPPERVNSFFLSPLIGSKRGPTKLDDFMTGVKDTSDSLFSNHGSAPPIGFERPWKSSTANELDPPLVESLNAAAYESNDWLDFGLSKPTSESVWEQDGNAGVQQLSREMSANPMNPWGQKVEKVSPWPSSYPWSSTKNVAANRSFAASQIDSGLETALDNTQVVKLKETVSLPPGYNPFSSSLHSIWNTPTSGHKELGNNKNNNSCSSWGANSYFGSSAASHE